MNIPFLALMRTKGQGFVAALAVIGLPMAVQAAEPGRGDVNQTWTLSTDDTELTLAVTDNTISIVSLRNPVQKWNWIPAPSRVPMPGVQTGKAGQAADLGVSRRGRRQEEWPSGDLAIHLRRIRRWN